METNIRNISKFQAPSWCFNGHLHTIGCSFNGNTTLPDLKRIEIPTPDDDFLELDCAVRPDSQALITLFHGLEGSSRRYYMVQLMEQLLGLKMSVVAVNFRSCGSKMNNKPRFYHSGATDDYITVFRWIQERHPNQRIGAVGFSLGANALIKSLAEKGSRHPAEAAVAVSTPYDLQAGSILLSQGFNKIYEHYFLRTLRRKLSTKRKSYPGLPTFNGRTLFEFDDKVTAPIHGFDGAEDYYNQCSSRQFIPEVAKPTLLIHSRQDPICPIDSFPVDDVRNNPSMDYIITDEGGHVGFWSKPKGWLNGTIGNYFARKLLA
ncbi:YheT family hydrolase [Fodinibius salsisoli]|uniref:Alpha/beta fold hydrolase n=1 Tax=Fodinibius salsisoli TaxID=2820877 RepID=A0ABT3PS57_9BACT|nr:alpha/beta fold hydrolase [Fodinibius salsisoli]MCW9708693.1 alpha/beta fold hydrolase [Fodinibius salsisoli]